MPSINLKNLGASKTEEKEKTRHEEQAFARKLIIRIFLYILTLLGAISVYLYVHSYGSSYLLIFTLAFFIVLSSVEVRLTSAEREGFSLITKLFHRK